MNPHTHNPNFSTLFDHDISTEMKYGKICIFFRILVAILDFLNNNSSNQPQMYSKWILAAKNPILEL